MGDTPRVLVIIPAYNESACILDTVHKKEACGYDYVVVNDGSKDNTLAICRENGLNVLDLPQNLGIDDAVQAGHKYAQRLGSILIFGSTEMGSTIRLIFPVLLR